MTKPSTRPRHTRFSSGPCAKRPGWTLEALSEAEVGRSHRSAPGRAKLREVIDRSRRLLELPEGYRCAIVPGSDTGAVEMAVWSLLGPRGVDVLAWESFGLGWVKDLEQLRLPDLRRIEAGYGELPDLEQVGADRDVVFVWNGTTSGVMVPDGDWIRDDRTGLTICDATSAVFAVRLPWHKLDVATWSWQKVLGGEAGHGMLVLGPRAVERLESYTPPWPMPKLFRMTRQGRLNQELFQGDTINTPSLLATEDALDGLRWAESVGGVPGLIKRSLANTAALTRWVEKTDWIDFLARVPATRSRTSVCLRFVDPWFEALAPEERAAFSKRFARLLETQGVASDVASYREAPPGLRIWCGATVETSDIEALLAWLDWAWAELRGA